MTPATPKQPLKVGLALGGGGARALAHIGILEILDELNLHPSAIAASSAGAVIGALYAGGVKPKFLRETLTALSLPAKAPLREIIRRRKDWAWLGYIAPEWDGRGLIKADKVLAKILSLLPSHTFQDLCIPLTVVATDFWAREPVVINRGELLPALEASMAVPGMVAPVVIDGRPLVDGSIVNPVPWDLLPRDCDLRIAVDVVGRRIPKLGRPASLGDLVFNTFETAEVSLNQLKRRHDPPDLYVAPELLGIGLLEFHRARDIFEQAAPAWAAFRKELEGRMRGSDYAR